MEGINILDHMVGIGVTLLTTGFFGLIGFVWKVSHKVSMHQKEIEALDKRVLRLTRDVDKNNDKVYSIVKNL